MMNIVMSNLAFSVFEEVDLPMTLEVVWWIEQRLQHMRINGLIKMINSSKSKDIKYIDGYLPKYKWATRPEKQDITGHLWIFELLQITQQNFAWNLWTEFIKINDILLFRESVLTAIKFGAGAAYALSIYKNKTLQVQANIDTMRQQLIVEPLPSFNREISVKTSQQWANLREMI